MLEAYRIGQAEDGQDKNPRKLRKFNLEGTPTVAIAPHEGIDVVIGNDNRDGSTSVISIYVDDKLRETVMLEYEMIRKLQFRNKETPDSSVVSHVYDSLCTHCANGKGHVIRVDDIALGEPNFMRLRLANWTDLLNKIGEDSLSRFNE